MPRAAGGVAATHGNVTVPVLRSIRPTLLPPWFATKAKLPSGATAAEMGVENPEYGQVIVLVSMLILPTVLPSQVRPKVPQGAIEISYGVLLENPVYLEWVRLVTVRTVAASIATHLLGNDPTLSTPH